MYVVHGSHLHANSNVQHLYVVSSLFCPVDVANTVMPKFVFLAKTATCETALTLAPTEWKASFLLRPCLERFVYSVSAMG